MVAQSKILIFGATGYLGKYMVKASVSMGHPTYIYVRPTTNATNSSRLELLEEFESMGVKVFQGELHEHDKLVSVIQQVDVVISTLPVPQYLEQLKIIDAIKDAGTIKRFIPSEYGNEVDRVSVLPPFQAVLDIKKRIRRTTEAAGIPHTFVSGNSFAAYFVDYFLHPHEGGDEVMVYGSGEAKAVLNFEKDVAAYTIMAANDPRTCNRLIIYRPPGNIISLQDLICSWEKRTGRTFKKTFIPDEKVVKLSETLPYPDNIPMSILHSIFIKGDQTNFELEENDLEASNLYPEYKYTSIDQYLNLCAVDPPKTQRAAFA